MKGTIILILSIVAASVTLVLVAGLVITPKDDHAPSLVSSSRGGERMIVGSISFDFPNGFAVASRSVQLPASGSIPVCDLGFDYCFYDSPNEVSSTSNESVGLRINTKMVQNEDSCINKIPVKSEYLRPEVIRRKEYSTSYLGPVELVSGSDRSYGYIYRIFEDGNCYELESRLVSSATPEGIVKSSLARLNPVIDSMSLLSSGERVLFSY